MKYCKRRFQWIEREAQAIQDKSLSLMSKLERDDLAQDDLWREITEHIANIESHCANALHLLAIKEKEAQQEAKEH